MLRTASLPRAPPQPAATLREVDPAPLDEVGSGTFSTEEAICSGGATVQQLMTMARRGSENWLGEKYHKVFARVHCVGPCLCFVIVCYRKQEVADAS